MQRSGRAQKALGVADQDHPCWQSNKHQHRNEHDKHAIPVCLDEVDHDAEEEQHVDPTIIAEIKTQIDKMSVSEAVMRMELAEQNAVMFRNASNSKLNMVYLRKDGNIGWIEPDNQ